ncbi:LOW QUALITY PROTEIN: solute carrier family 7 member 13 [Glossophaga mutica]
MVPTRVLEYSCMNMGLSLFWALCALLSLTTTLCSVEIGRTFSCSGVHYYFLKRCFSSYAVATTWMNIVIPHLTWVVPFGISASLFRNLLINVFQLLRVTCIEGQDDQLPLWFNINIYACQFILLTTMAFIAIVSTNLIDLINYLYFVVSILSVLSMTE